MWDLIVSVPEHCLYFYFDWKWELFLFGQSFNELCPSPSKWCFIRYQSFRIKVTGSNFDQSDFDSVNGLSDFFQRLSIQQFGLVLT